MRVMPIDYSWWSCENSQRVDKGFGRLRNSRTSRDHSHYSIICIYIVWWSYIYIYIYIYICVCVSVCVCVCVKIGGRSYAWINCAIGKYFLSFSIYMHFFFIFMRHLSLKKLKEFKNIYHVYICVSLYEWELMYIQFSSCHYAYIHTYRQTDISIYVNNIYIYIYIYMQTYIQGHYIYIISDIYIYIYIWRYIYIYIYEDIYIYIYIYIYLHLEADEHVFSHILW